MNAPVTWLERRGTRRTAATLVVAGAVVIVVGLLAWLVLPRIITESRSLADNFPEYVSNLRNQLARALGEGTDLAGRTSWPGFSRRCSSQSR